MPNYWWDDALALANELAAGTRIRHSVRQGADGYWLVEPVMTTVEPVEVCS